MERNPSTNPQSPPAADRRAPEMTGRGKLVFQITTASGAIPLEGAEIILRKYRSESDGNGGDVVIPDTVTAIADNVFKDNKIITSVTIPGTVQSVGYVAVLYSGGDGKTEVLTLPAPARSLSLEPARDGAPIPYALYDAEVNLDHYFRQSYIRIPVFDGITSIQRASLIPLPENGYSQGLRPDGEVFYEGESPNL